MSFFFRSRCCFQALFCPLVVVAGTDWCKPCWGTRGEVCGSVCHPAGGTEHALRPLETVGRPWPLTGKTQDCFDVTLFLLLF